MHNELITKLIFPFNANQILNSVNNKDFQVKEKPNI
jgi:hypothetical protein